jgi:hypothetical protein
MLIHLLLFRCETCPLTLRKKHKLGLKREEIRGGWIKLHNEELQYLYFTPNFRMIKSRRIRSTYGRNEQTILFEKPGGKRPGHLEGV